MFDLNKLPVAPEFVETLQENALEVAKAQLKKLDVPEEVINLVEKVHDLGYYVAECYRSPENLMAEDKLDRFDIEDIVVEAVNLIAKLGGKFYGPQTNSESRKDASPAKPFRSKR